MRVIKNINNNTSLCLDESGRQVIVFGKGIGFKKPPFEIDTNQIQRVFYEVDESYIQMLKDIPDDILEISSLVVDYAKKELKYQLRSNIIFTLADHINFAVKRNKDGNEMKLAIEKDLLHLFENEIKIGKMALNLIDKKLGIKLPEEEISFIAMHIINAQTLQSRKEKVNDKILKDINIIIERHFNIKINKNGFNYSRFTTHILYLLKRGKDDALFKSENSLLFDSLILKFPEIYECTKKIKLYLEKKLSYSLTEEECVYIMIHLNRLCTREDCYL